MEVFKTKSVLQSFIVIQNFFCINRSFLIEDRKTKFICNFIFAVVLTTKTCTVIYDLLFSEYEKGLHFLIIQLFASAEITYLATFARRENCFAKIEVLDDIAIFHETFNTKLKQAVTKAIVFYIFSVAFELIAFTLDIYKLTVTLTFFIESLAHDSEFMLYGLLINAINLRLANLSKLPDNFGSKVYANIVITAAYMREDFATEITILFIVTFFKLTIFMAYVILFNTLSIVALLYLTCLQLKSVFIIWIMCSQSANTALIWKQLTTRLATKLVFDPKICKDTKSNQYRCLYRWYSCMKEGQPSFYSGRLLSLNMAIPLQLIDLSINYVLIGVQAKYHDDINPPILTDLRWFLLKKLIHVKR